MKLKEYEDIYNKIVNQVIFVNSLGEVEYHPERLRFLVDYYYYKNILGYKFSKEYDFDTDMFSLAFYQDIADDMKSIKKDKLRSASATEINQWNTFVVAIESKIEFEKSRLITKSNYGITDVYLGSLLSKLADWIEDKGIENFIDICAKTGEALEKNK